MTEPKNRIAKYNYEADKRYIASQSAEQRLERIRRAKFSTAKNFITKKQYRNDELEILSALIKNEQADNTNI